MDYLEYIKDIKKVGTKRVSTLNHSYGTINYFKWYKKHIPQEGKFNISYKLYSDIIKEVNKRAGEYLAEGNVIKFPMGLGELDIREFKINPTLDKSGNLVYKAAVNWAETLKLWHEDEESRDKKRLVKMDYDRIYRVFYTKKRNEFSNKFCVYFKHKRGIKKDVQKNAILGRINAFKSI